MTNGNFGKNNNGRFCRNNCSPEETVYIKGIFPCQPFKKFGHCANNYNEDGSLRLGVKCSDTPLNYDSNDSYKNVKKKQVMIGFNSTFFSTNDSINMKNTW